MAGIVEKLSSSRFRKCITTAFMVVLLYLMISSFALPLLVDLPKVQLWALKTVKPALACLAALAALHVFPLLEHLRKVKSGAPLFPQPKSYKHQPWPPHSHPVARKSRWGPVQQEHEVLRKKTHIVLKTKYYAVQNPARTQVIFTLLLALIGAALLLFPVVMRTGFVAGLPFQLEFVQEIAYMAWPLFVFWALVFLTAAFVIFLSKLPFAIFDKEKNTCYLKYARCYGLFDSHLNPDITAFNYTDIAGLQMAHHRSSSIRRNERRIDQYELIVVLNDGVRHLIAKGSRYQSVLKDATQLAGFLGVHVWDRSSRYYPENPAILSSDPLVKPL